MRYVYGILLCGLLAGLWTLAYGETPVIKETADKSHTMPRLASLNNEERIKLLEQWSKDRSDMQTALISQLDESNPKEVTFAIGYALGLHRIEQAVPHLSKYIALEADTGVEKRRSLWDQYPIVEALIRIGNPSVPEMLKNIEITKDKKVRELSARVIRYVMGLDIAKVVLEKVMEGKSEAVKANFKAAIESMREQQAPEAKPAVDRHGLPETRPVSQ